MTNDTPGNRALAEAIEKAGGSQAALGKLIGVTQQTISNWLKSKIAAEYVLAIERETGVPRYRLRPDIYPPADWESAA